MQAICLMVDQQISRSADQHSTEVTASILQADGKFFLQPTSSHWPAWDIFFTTQFCTVDTLGLDPYQLV